MAWQKAYFVDPRDFGAKGNDPDYDDGPGIQASIDCLAEHYYAPNPVPPPSTLPPPQGWPPTFIDRYSSFRGGFVIIPKGIYRVGAPLDLKRGVGLIGVGNSGVAWPGGSGYGGSSLVAIGDQNFPIIRLGQHEHYENVVKRHEGGNEYDDYLSHDLPRLGEEFPGFNILANLSIVGNRLKENSVGIKIGQLEEITQIKDLYGQNPQLLPTTYRVEETRLIIENITIFGCNIGMLFEDCWGALISRMMIWWNNTGVKIKFLASANFLNCTIQDNYKFNLDIQGGGTNQFQDCNIETHSLSNTGNVNVEGTEGRTVQDYLFTNIHFEEFPTSTVPADRSIVKIGAGTRNIAFRHCYFSGITPRDFDNDGGYHHTFDHCTHIHTVGYPASKKYYKIGQGAQITSILNPMFLESSGSGGPLPASMEKVISENIQDEGYITIFDLPGFGLMRPDRIIGLSDGTISSAAYSSLERMNLLRKSFGFGASPWTALGVTLTEVTISGFKCWQMTYGGPGDGYVEQTAGIVFSDNIPWLLAVQMGTENPTAVKLEAQYCPDGDTFTVTHTVEAEGSWHLLQMGPNSDAQSQVRVRIYAVDGAPIFLADSSLVSGTRFLGAIPNPTSSPLTRPANCLSSPRVWTPDLIFPTPGGNDVRHRYWTGTTPPTSGDYQVGDLLFTSDPYGLGWFGLGMRLGEPAGVEEVRAVGDVISALNRMKKTSPLPLASWCFI